MNTLKDIAVSLMGTAGLMVFVIPYVAGWAELNKQIIAPFRVWVRGVVARMQLRQALAAMRADAAQLAAAVGQLDQQFAAMRRDLQEVVE